MRRRMRRRKFNVGLVLILNNPPATASKGESSNTLLRPDWNPIRASALANLSSPCFPAPAAPSPADLGAGLLAALLPGPPPPPLPPPPPPLSRVMTPPQTHLN